MKSSLCRWVVILSSSFLLFSSPVFPTSVKQASFKEYCDLARGISHVSVRGIEVRENREGLVTIYRLEVRAWIKGEGKQEIELMIPGGRLGKKTTKVHGAPSLKMGENYVVFLWRRLGEDPYTILGLHGGLYRVGKNPEGEDRVDGLYSTAESLSEFMGRILETLEKSSAKNGTKGK